MYLEDIWKFFGSFYTTQEIARALWKGRGTWWFYKGRGSNNGLSHGGNPVVCVLNKNIELFRVSESFVVENYLPMWYNISFSYIFVFSCATSIWFMHVHYSWTYVRQKIFLSICNLVKWLFKLLHYSHYFNTTISMWIFKYRTNQVLWLPPKDPHYKKLAHNPRLRSTQQDTEWTEHCNSSSMSIKSGIWILSILDRQQLKINWLQRQSIYHGITCLLKIDTCACLPFCLYAHHCV